MAVFVYERYTKIEVMLILAQEYLEGDCSLKGLYIFIEVPIYLLNCHSFLEIPNC